MGMPGTATKLFTVRKTLRMLETAPLAGGRVRDAVRAAIRPLKELHFRTVRPSLLDLRFCGDPWIVARADGRAAILLGDYCVTSLEADALDLPSLNHLFDMMRHRRPRTHARTGKAGTRR
jgi:hypothetical protein